MFEALGLTTSESTVYAALVNNPRPSAAELARHASLPETDTRRAIQELIRRGLANRLPGAEPRYIAVAPDIAVEPLIVLQEDKLRQARHASHDLMAAFRESSRHTHPAELIEVITGPDNIASRVNHLHDTARVQIRGFDRPPYAMRPDTSRTSERQRLAEGVSYRVIYTKDSLSWPGRVEDIREGCECGEQAKVRPELPVKLLVIDDRLAFVPVKTDGDRVEAALMIHPCDLFDALVALFESEWERAIPLRSYLDRDDPPADGEAPDHNTTALLLALAAGLTDDSIARSLDWSLRTTQRHIQRLMRSLNASTRFQAGLEARDRGWA